MDVTDSETTVKHLDSSAGIAFTMTATDSVDSQRQWSGLPSSFSVYALKLESEKDLEYDEKRKRDGSVVTAS